MWCWFLCQHSAPASFHSRGLSRQKHPQKSLASGKSVYMPLDLLRHRQFGENLSSFHHHRETSRRGIVPCGWVKDFRWIGQYFQSCFVWKETFEGRIQGDVPGRRLSGRYIPGHGRVYLLWLCFMNFLYLFIKKSIDKAYYMSYSIFKPILYDI